MEATETISDVKPVAESSTATTIPPEAPSSDTTSTEASKAPASDRPSLEDTLAERAKELLAPESSQDEKVEEQAEQPSKEEPAKPEETKEAEDPKAKEAKKEDTKSVPYERFTEVNEKAQRFEQELKDEKPYADSQRELIKYLTNHNISEKRFFEWMDVAAKFETDPAKALELLTPLVKQLGEYSGDTLSPEHQKMLDEGIPKEFVMRLAKAEGKAKSEARRSELTQKQQQQAAQQAQIRQFVADGNAQIEAFVTSKKSDVDFTPKKNGEPDGKYELFQLGLQMALQNGSVKQLSDIPKVAAQVYDNVTATLSRYAPKPKANGKHVSSTKSNGTTTNGAPKSFEEAAQLMLKRNHGLDFKFPARK